MACRQEMYVVLAFSGNPFSNCGSGQGSWIEAFHQCGIHLGVHQRRLTWREAFRSTPWFHSSVHCSGAFELSFNTFSCLYTAPSESSSYVHVIRLDLSTEPWLSFGQHDHISTQCAVSHPAGFLVKKFLNCRLILFSFQNIIST